MALQACELRANLTKAMPLDSFVCLSRTTQISWISPNGEKRSLSTDSGVYLLITRKMRLLGGSSRLSTPGRKPPPLVQLPASSMVLHQTRSQARGPASPPRFLRRPTPTAVAGPTLRFRKAEESGAVRPYRLPASGEQPAAPPGDTGEPNSVQAFNPVELRPKHQVCNPHTLWSEQSLLCTGFSSSGFTLPSEAKDSYPKLAILVISSTEDHRKTELRWNSSFIC